MQRRRLGSSGLKVPLVGLGCNNFGARMEFEDSKKVIHKAIDLGIDFLDTADRYGQGGSEKTLGEVLGSKRKDVIIATKCGKVMPEGKGGSRRYIMAACENSLTRLKTDWIDLFYMHDPDPETPIEESLRALDDLVRQGKVRYIGNSNFAAWQVAAADWAARLFDTEHFVCAQDQYNLLERGIEKEMLPALKEHGLGLVPYFPLASGLLTGKYKKDAMPAGARMTVDPSIQKRHRVEENWGIVAKLEDFAKTRGHSMTELAFSWLAACPQVSSIIAGASRPEQLEQNVKATEWALSAADMAEIDKITAKP